MHPCPRSLKAPQEVIENDQASPGNTVSVSLHTHSSTSPQPPSQFPNTRWTVTSSGDQVTECQRKEQASPRVVGSRAQNVRCGQDKVWAQAQVPGRGSRKLWLWGGVELSRKLPGYLGFPNFTEQSCPSPQPLDPHSLSCASQEEGACGVWKRWRQRRSHRGWEAWRLFPSQA